MRSSSPRPSSSSAPALRESAQIPERRVALQMPRETLLIRRQARADDVVSPIEAKLTHFEHRLIRAPAFGHTIGGHHHPRPVVAQPAMHKYPLVWILLEYSQESHEEIVLRERTVPRNCNVPHSEAAHLFTLAVGPVAPCVHHNLDSHFRQRLESLMVWLPAAKKPWRHFTEIANALDFPLLPERAYRMQLRCGAAAFVLRLFAATHRDNQQQHEGEQAETTKCPDHSRLRQDSDRSRFSGRA